MKALSTTILMLAVSLAACALSPEQVEGRWKSDAIKIQSGQDQTVKMTCEYNFGQDLSVEAKYKLDFNVKYDRVSVDAFYTMMGKGQYEITNDSILIVLDPQTVNTDISEDDVRITASGMTAQDPIAQRSMQTQFADMLRESAAVMQAQLTESADVLSNVSVDKKKMTCTAGNNQMTLKKK